MVSVAIAVSSLGASNIHVLEPGVKVNVAYYRGVVLRQILLPDIHAASGSEFFLFFRRSMPHHITPKTQQRCWIKRRPILSHSLSGRLTHRTLTQLTTLCGVLQEQVYHTKISDIDEPKWRINSDWAALSYTVIERAVGEWRQRLRACVRAGGGHFEHML